MSVFSILYMLTLSCDLYPRQSLLSMRRDLGANSLTGTIPPQLGKLTALWRSLYSELDRSYWDPTGMYAPARRRHPPSHLSANRVTPNADHLNPVYAGTPK